MIAHHGLILAVGLLISSILVFTQILPYLTASWLRATVPNRMVVVIAAFGLAFFAGAKHATNAPPPRLSAPRPQSLAAFPNYRHIPDGFLVPEDFYLIRSYTTPYTPVVSAESAALWALRGAFEDWWPSGDYAAAANGTVIGTAGEFAGETIGYDSGRFAVAGMTRLDFGGRCFSWSNLCDARTNAVNVRIEISPLEITIQTNDLASVFRKLYNPQRDHDCSVQFAAATDASVVSGCVRRVISASWSSPNIIRGSVTLDGEVNGKIMLWSDSDCTTPLNLPLTVDAYDHDSLRCYATFAEPSESLRDLAFTLTLTGEAYGPDGHALSVDRELRLTSVLFSGLDATSEAAGNSLNPPPFPLGANDFNYAYTPTPDRHLLIPFKNVVNRETMAVNDYTITLRPEIEPAAAELDVALSGDGYGPTEAGIYDLSAVCDRLFAFGAVVLPQSGAEISQIVLRDLARTSNFVDRAMSELSERFFCRHLMATRWFGTTDFGRYRGRPDALSSPTVRVYNQVDDTSGLGAYATLFGYPVGLGKVTSIVCGYACELMHFTDDEHSFVQQIGTSNTPAATFVWESGRQIAHGTNATEAVELAARTCWLESDAKGDVLWPNASAPDNYLDTPYANDANEHFHSPGFLLADPLEFTDWYDVIERELIPLAELLYTLWQLQ